VRVTPDLDELAERLACLAHNDLVEVLRRVFEKHPPEQVRHVERRYLLAVSNHAGGMWEITGVGYPLVETMVDLQDGRCSHCGLEIQAPAKQARCPACLQSCGLT
jgi:hypothetical protein